MRNGHQTQNFQGMFQALCHIFKLINKEEGSPKQFWLSKFSEFFFFDCSIVDSKLVFVPSYSVVSDMLIEIGVQL